MLLECLLAVVAVMKDEALVSKVLPEEVGDLEAVTVMNNYSRGYEVVIANDREVSNASNSSCFNFCDSHIFSR